MLTLKYICMSVKISFIQEGPIFLFQTNDSSKHSVRDTNQKDWVMSHMILAHFTLMVY